MQREKKRKKNTKNLQRWCDWAHGSCCEANKEFMTSCFTLDVVADGLEDFFFFEVPSWSFQTPLDSRGVNVAGTLLKLLEVL